MIAKSGHAEIWFYPLTYNTLQNVRAKVEEDRYHCLKYPPYLRFMHIVKAWVGFYPNVSRLEIKVLKHL